MQVEKPKKCRQKNLRNRYVNRLGILTVVRPRYGSTINAILSEEHVGCTLIFEDCRSELIHYLSEFARLHAEKLDLFYEVWCCQ